jgi:predicted nucleic acid-binding Zn ribbon protein
VAPQCSDTNDNRKQTTHIMPRGPEKIGNVLGELMARQGYARVQSSGAREAAWRQAAGELAAQYTRVGSVRRGKLEVVVANSTLMQELTYQKTDLLSSLAELLPDETINDLRFRVGAID